MIILISAKPQLLYDKHIKQQESLPKLDSSIDRGTSFNFKPGHIQAYTIWLPCLQVAYVALYCLVYVGYFVIILKKVNSFLSSQTDHGVDIGGRIIQWRH
ncbi:hypothetical protein P8452_66779 [Trifolium repens]|nr:hypothetical protein P8452_08701 [Trifolium repens]WJX84179.1 hypothetical protein P8452_66779 [Trifolium repens]